MGYCGNGKNRKEGEWRERKDGMEKEIVGDSIKGKERIRKFKVIE